MTRNRHSSKPHGHLRFFFRKIEIEEEKNKQTNKEQEKKVFDWLGRENNLVPTLFASFMERHDDNSKSYLSKGNFLGLDPHALDDKFTKRAIKSTLLKWISTIRIAWLFYHTMYTHTYIERLIKVYLSIRCIKYILSQLCWILLTGRWGSKC